MQTLRSITEPLLQHRLQGETQRQMQSRSQGAEQDHLPVAKLVARRLDQQRLVSWQTAGCQHLSLNIVAQIAGRGGVQVEFSLQPLRNVRLVEPPLQFP